MQTILVGAGDDLWERDWIEFLFDGFDLQYVQPSECSFVKPSTLLLSDSDGRYARTMRELLKKFSVCSTPVGIVHLSDEFCECPIDFYRGAKFVVRNYYRPYAISLCDCIHVPLGYKSGFRRYIQEREVERRTHKWFFAGQPKGKRTEMLTVAKAIPGGRWVTTSRWNDSNGLSVEEYAREMNNAVVALCPRGNNSVDSFRMYEALEAGALPIVEDDGRFDQAMQVVHVPAGIRSWRPPGRIGRYSLPYRAMFGPSYWLSMYGSDFPVPRLYRWKALPRLLDDLDVASVSSAAIKWWGLVKQSACRQVRGAAKALLAGDGVV